MGTVVSDVESSEFRNLCRNYQNGDLNEIYTDFKNRFVNESDSADQLRIEQFVFESEAARGLIQRVQSMPVDLTLELVEKDGGESLLKEWQEYFEGPNFDGMSLSLILPNIYENMEVGGASLIVASPNPDGSGPPIWIQHTNVEYFPETADNNILAINAYKFTYYMDEIGDETKQQKELVIRVKKDGQEVSFDGVQVEDLTFEKSFTDANNDQILPVVVFCRKQIPHSKYCRPGMADLLNGQRNLNSALTKRNEATKYDSFGVWCPDDVEFAGTEMKDANGASAWKIRPGTYTPFPVKKVGGSTSIASIEKEIEEARDAIRSQAMFLSQEDSRNRRTATDSGKALIVSSRGMRAYKDQFMTKVVKAANQMLEISGIIWNKSTEGIRFKMPELEREDPDHVLKKTQLLDAMGFDKEALRLLDYDEDKIKELIAERNAGRIEENRSFNDGLTQDEGERG